MTIKISHFIGISFAALLLLNSCKKTPLEQMISTELARGVRVDTLFQGLKFGMKNQEFRDLCTEKNKQQLFTNNGLRMEVEYKTDELGAKASMTFMPEFKNDKIVVVPVSIHYDTWASWNKDKSSDSLLVRVLPMLERWHGGTFTPIETPTKTKAWVRVDGNRLIIVSKKDERIVSVLYKDMAAE